MDIAVILRNTRNPQSFRQSGRRKFFLYSFKKNRIYENVQNLKFYLYIIFITRTERWQIQGHILRRPLPIWDKDITYQVSQTPGNVILNTIYFCLCQEIVMKSQCQMSLSRLFDKCFLTRSYIMSYYLTSPHN